MTSTTKKLRAHLSIESLEDRLALSLYHTQLSGTTLIGWCNDSVSNVRISRSGSATTISDSTNGFSQTYYSPVNLAQVVGGASADRIVNMVYSLPMQAWGKGGNDYLEGYNGADDLMGDEGDDTLVCYGGNDRAWGGTGRDVLRGMDGDDQLMGGDQDDRLNGGNGNDKFWGGNGNDVNIAIDNATGDRVEESIGCDITWVDRTWFWSDSVFGAGSDDKIQYVSSFANGADRTLNGDRIADPTAKSGHTYRRFAGNPLFGNTGRPLGADIRQGSLGDCWMLAGLSAIAYDNSFAIRQNVVDFDDGTYGVRLGNSFYRVDDDLAVSSSWSTTPVYAKLGANNSMWVAVVEKAYAHYRTGANTMASIEGGWGIEVNQAFGSASAGRSWFSGYSSATALANDIYARWASYQAVTVGFLSVASGAPLVGMHMYTVYSVQKNSLGVVTSITLRNPWGYDGAGSDSNTSDGLVTVTPSQIFNSNGQVNWGRV